MASPARSATRSARRSWARAKASTADSSSMRRTRKTQHAGYGPFDIEKRAAAHHADLHGGFRPERRRRTSANPELCATCHTLYHHGARSRAASDRRVSGTDAVSGMAAQRLSRTSKAARTATCREVNEQVPVTRVFGVPREGLHQHTFVAANFFMLRMLNRYRSDLSVSGAAPGVDRRRRDTVAFPAIAGGADRDRFRRRYGRAGSRPRCSSKISAATNCPPPIRPAGPGCTSLCATATGRVVFESGL